MNFGDYMSRIYGYTVIIIPKKKGSNKMLPSHYYFFISEYPIKNQKSEILVLNSEFIASPTTFSSAPHLCIRGCTYKCPDQDC